MRARAAATVLATLTLLAGCTTTTSPGPAGPSGTGLGGRTSEQAASPSGVPTAGSPSGAAAAGPAVEEEQPAPAVPSSDATTRSDALARAEGFVRAWARPDLDATTWFSGVRGFLSPAAAEGFIWTDPATVPATTVTGPPAFLEEPAATSARVVVPTDAGDQYVLLIHSDDQTPWQVAVLAADAQGLEQQ